MDIYGNYYNAMTRVMNSLVQNIEENSRKHEDKLHGYRLLLKNLSY